MAYFDGLFSAAKAPVKQAEPVKQSGQYFPNLFSGQAAAKPATPPVYKPIFSKVTTHKMSPSLGGGEFNLPANDLTTSTRSQEPIGPSKKGFERDHIIPVSLGGVSSKENLQYLENNKGVLDKVLGRQSSPEERQSGKMAVEWQVIDDYKNNKISLAEARGKILQKQRELKGLDPKQGVAPYIVPAVKETVKDTGQGIKKVFSKISSTADDLSTGIDPALKDQLIKRGETEKLKQLEQDELNKMGLKDFRPANQSENFNFDEKTKENQKKAVNLGASILQAPQRAITSVAGEGVAGILGLLQGKEKEFAFEPKTTLEKALFGKEPIKGIFTRTDDAQKQVQAALEKIGFDKDAAKGQAFAIAPLFMAGSIGLDLTPFGGEKNTAKLVAKSKSADEIFNLIKPMLKNTADDELRVVAKELTTIDHPEAVKDILLKKVVQPTEAKAAEVIVPEAKPIFNDIPFESRNPNRIIRPITPETKKMFSKVSPKEEGVISASQERNLSTLEHTQSQKSLPIEQGIHDLSSKIEGKALQKAPKINNVSYSESITKPLLSQGEAKSAEIIHDLNDASHGPAEKFTTPPNILEKADKFKDISGFKAQAKDVYRNFKHVFGDKYQDIKKTLLDPFDAAKGKYIDYQKKVLDEMDQKIVKGLGIRKRSKESAAVMDYGEGLLKEGELLSSFGVEKGKKIKQAAEWFRGKYDTLLEEVNAARKEIYPNNPDKIIPKRKDYFRHFEELSTGLGALKNIFENPAGISPKLAGLSEFTTPRSKWLAFAQRRVLNDSTRDAVGGFLNYVPSASYAVNIDPFIGQFRKLGRELADKTEGSKNINNFIEFLHDFSNDLSGKSNAADRFIQKVIPGGRKTFGVINWLNNRIKANAILGNLSSAVSQIFNVPQGIASAKQYSIPGATRTLAQIFQPNDAMKLSSFIKERYSSSLYSKFDTGILANTKKFAAWVVGALDEVGTKFIWNSHYEKAIAEKITDPVKYADDVTRSLVAGRGIGEVPLIQKSKIFQLIAPFQLEVGNLWYVMGDMVKKKDFGGIATLFVANYLMNRVAEKVRGSDVTFDPINALIEGFRNQAKDESIQGKGIKIGGRLLGEVLSNIPLGQTAASLYPEQGAKIPGVGKMTRSELFGEGDPTRTGSGLLTTQGLSDPLFKLVPGFAGGQIKKSYQGTKALIEGEQKSKSGYPQFEVPKTPENIVRAEAFGPYATTEGQEYSKAKDRKASLQAAQTRQAQLEESKIQPKFDHIQSLMAEGKTDEATQLWSALSDQEKVVYKKMKTKSKSQQTDAAELKMSPLVEQLQQLKQEGKNDEAFAEWDKLSDEEKRIYALAKKKLGY